MVKKILILSDSHGRSENIRLAIVKEKPDMLIHLGDIEDDPERVRKWLGLAVPAVFVQGNCDRYGGYDLQKSAVFELNGHKFFCAHGHMQGVNYGLRNLMYTSSDVGISKKSIRILNPGSISLPRGGSRRTYMIMTFDSEGNFIVKLKKLFI